ncbi:MAG: AAA family ATPase [Cyanobacteriota bacterium]|nr:AAA family ATPase [Cyanobacteriota bacterium]
MDPLIASLLRPEAYPHPTGAIRLLETHISWILLTGDIAYKVKKPVRLGFVDFGTLERRRHFCQEELRLNQRLAAELYLDLVEIHGPPERARVGGAGRPIEVAVRMRQFDQSGLLPRALAAGAVTGDHLEAFAERLAAFHAAAAVASPEGPYGRAEAVVAPARANLEVLGRCDREAALAPLVAWTEAEAQRLQPVFADRLARGRVREGHGDLHLGNLVLHQGAVVGFDCLEFNPELRWIDVLSDVAFLAMDLRQRQEPLLACRVLSRWLSACGDYGALATWRWYGVYRALVRAKVLALRLAQLDGAPPAEREALADQLRSYLHLAHRISASPGPGALVLMHGVSGSGKSHLARALCQRHGWIHLRSDVERRRRFGGWGTPFDPVRQGDPYAPAVTAELYGVQLPAAAEAVLRAGLPVVVDATFLTRERRRGFQALADRLGARWLLLSCPVSLAVARERLAQRRREGGDPSEADGAVLLAQWQALEPPGADEQPHHLTVTGLEEAEEKLRARWPDLPPAP